VTGGAGYVGSLLIEHLHKMHFLREHIICVDPGWFGFNEVHKTCMLQKNICRTSIKSFTASQEHMKKICEETEAIIHLGGLSNDPMADYDAEANNDVNFVQTTYLVEFCKNWGIPRFIFASSASVYGDMEESLCKEDGFISPKSNYAMSKAKAEDHIIKNIDKTFRPIILRKGTLYGVSPRMRLDLAINTMVVNAFRFGKIELYGGGENWRPLTHVMDAVRLYEFLATMDYSSYKQLSGKIYNVVGENFRMSELGLRLADITKVNVVPRYDMLKDVRTYRLDGTLLRSLSLFDFSESKKLTKTVNDLLYWMKGKDLDNPIYWNMRHIKTLEKSCEIMGIKFDLMNR